MICNLCKAEPCEPWCKYEYPIHQLPQETAVDRVVTLLRDNGDHYGVQLVTENADKLR